MTPVDEFAYIVLILGLFVVPRILERIFIPSGITAFVLGIILTSIFGFFHHDLGITLFAALGINSLFLFAGLEAKLEEIRNNAPIIVTHMISHALMLIGITAIVQFFFDLGLVVSSLFSLALLTPSTGFILDSIHSLNLSEEKKFWVKTKAIATELLALGLMFVLLQSHSLVALSFSTLGLVAIIAAVPMVCRLVSKTITPYVDHSEFGFFLALAVLAGILTKKLGAYYLVGAFIVGLAVQRSQDLFPKMDANKLMYALKLFSAFFVPFYFFHAGGKITFDHISITSIALGLFLFMAVSGLRIFSVVIPRWISFRESARESIPIGIALVPTLIFGLVIAQLLYDNYQLPSVYFGALVVYTLVSSIVPGFFLRNRQIQDVAEPFEVIEGRI